MELNSVKAPEKNEAENSNPSSQPDVVSSKIVRIRVSKEDSAYVYSILESYEGLCAYSTLEHRAGDHHRDLEMIVPVTQEVALRRLLETLKDELGGELHELRVE